MMDNLYAIFIGYFLGAIPSAYILIKLTSGKDLRNEGSGNIGARNSIESSGKKWIGAVVLILDLLKAFLATKLAFHFFDGDMYLVSMTAIFALLGHNYNVFLKFKGGRGLASAAGISLAVNPLVLIVWLVMYFTSMKVIYKNVHISSVVASLGMPLLIVSAPDYVLLETQTMIYADPTDVRVLSVAIGLVIIMKHIAPIREFLDKKDEEDGIEK